MDLMLDFLLGFYGPTPYILLFCILLACGFGLPIPEDITLFAGGVLSYYGICNVYVMIVVCLAGVLIGDSIVFWLGHHYGRKLTRVWFFKKILTEERLELVRHKFADRGNRMIFAARFMPGLRTPVFFSVGTLHVPFRVFFFYDGLAALISVPAIVGAVYYFGDQLEKVVDSIKKVEHGILALIALAILAFVAKRYLSRRKLNGGSAG